jgi:limonene-1,2-epoxide hydrolase
MDNSDTGSVADVIALVENFWEALGRRAFDEVGAYMSERGHYVDVPVIEIDEGAFGPAETAARLRLGLEPLQDYVLSPGPIVANPTMAVTEHSERWTWASGESVVLRFASVMEIRHGKVDRWWDYFDLSTLMNAAPTSWVEHIAVGYK